MEGKCSKCGGQGYIEYKSPSGMIIDVVCDICIAAGKVVKINPQPEFVTCEKCGGDGEVTCPACDGAGDVVVDSKPDEDDGGVTDHGWTYKRGEGGKWIVVDERGDVRADSLVYESDARFIVGAWDLVEAAVNCLTPKNSLDDAFQSKLKWIVGHCERTGLGCGIVAALKTMGVITTEEENGV